MNYRGRAPKNNTLKIKNGVKRLLGTTGRCIPNNEELEKLSEIILRFDFGNSRLISVHE